MIRTILPAAVLAGLAVVSGAGCGSSADAAPVAEGEVIVK